MSIEWQYYFSRAHLIHESLVESDHRPLILLLDPSPDRRNSDIISFAWRMPSGSLMYSFMQRLRAS